MEKIKKTSDFIQHNGHIIPKPEGLDCTLQNGKVYNLLHDKGEGLDYLSEDKDFEFPKTYYLTDKDNKFITKSINTFNNTDKMTTGVLLSGMKGSGKTLMAKKIAVESGLPIIVIDKNVYADDIEGFFANVNTDVCVIFDEIDKYWNTRYLLGFLDGVKPTCKKLVICTCNNEKEIDEYLNDRCSRIRYKKTFKGLTKETVAGILNDIINNKDKSDAAAEYFCSNVATVSHDNVIIFGEELKNNPDDSFDEIMEFLNIAKK
jgi:SpoVK/Ycf46/Vps4 family AAA+-type ATPase